MFAFTRPEKILRPLFLLVPLPAVAIPSLFVLYYIGILTG